jgi:hypothetical protein
MEYIYEKLLKKVDNTTRINDYELKNNITLKKSDINLSIVENMSLQNTLRVLKSNINYIITLIQLLTTTISNKVDKYITINNKTLSDNIILDKRDIGLNNIDNTSDLNKPISILTQNALNIKIDKPLIYNITSDITAVENCEYYIDTSLNEITITLPLLLNNSKIKLIDVNNTWYKNNLILLSSNNVKINNVLDRYNISNGNYLELYYNKNKSNWYFNNNKSYGEFNLNLSTIINNINILNWLPIIQNNINCIDNIFILNLNNFYNIIFQINFSNNNNGIINLIYQYSNDNGVTWITYSSLKYNNLNESICGNIFINTFNSNKWRFQIDNQTGSNLSIIQSKLTIINL